MILQPVIVPVPNVSAPRGETDEPAPSHADQHDVAAAPRGGRGKAGPGATAGEVGSPGATGGLSASADDRPSSDSHKIIKPRTPEQVTLQREAAAKALAHCAKLVGAPATGWQKNADGAPIPNQGFYWSISHKTKYACAVIADSPVGIDIEEITPRRDKLIFDELASEEEWSLMPDRSWESFFMLWTAKEAVLKANGVGIGRFADCRLVTCDATITPEDIHHQNPERKRAGQGAPDLSDLTQSEASSATITATFMDNPWQVSHFLRGEHMAAVTRHIGDVRWVAFNQ